MPKIYRSMFADAGKPKVGSESELLGVRAPPNPNADFPIVANGNVHPNTGGMSVAPDWRKLRLHLIPKRLNHLWPGACGRNDLVCWRLGDGDFEEGDVTDTLILRLDTARPDEHGFVEPSASMTFAKYQAALAATRDDWIEDEN